MYGLSFLTILIASLTSLFEMWDKDNIDLVAMILEKSNNASVHDITTQLKNDKILTIKQYLNDIEKESEVNV